jgi:hypothetical protein
MTDEVATGPARSDGPADSVEQRAGGATAYDDDLGGDAACWAHRVCQACGRLNAAERPVGCESCGQDFADW